MIGALGALDLHRGRDPDPVGAAVRAPGWSRAAVPSASLLVEAGIRGIAVPLTAAAVGGLIGAALWFTRPPNKADQHTGYVRARTGRLRRGGGRGLRRAGTRRRRARSAVAAAGHPSQRDHGGTSVAADRSSSRAAARGTRRDPLRRAGAVPALRPRRTRYGVLSGMRGRHTGPRHGRHGRSAASHGRSAASPTSRRATSPLPGYSVTAGTYDAPPVRTDVTTPAAADVGRGHRRRGASPGRPVGHHSQAARALRLPAGLRAPTDRRAGRGQSTLHRAGRRPSPSRIPRRVRRTRSPPARPGFGRISSAATAAPCS